MAIDQFQRFVDELVQKRTLPPLRDLWDAAPRPIGGAALAIGRFAARSCGRALCPDVAEDERQQQAHARSFRIVSYGSFNHQPAAARSTRKRKVAIREGIYGARLCDTVALDVRRAEHTTVTKDQELMAHYRDEGSAIRAFCRRCGWNLYQNTGATLVGRRRLWDPVLVQSTSSREANHV